MRFPFWLAPALAALAAPAAAAPEVAGAWQCSFTRQCELEDGCAAPRTNDDFGLTAGAAEAVLDPGGGAIPLRHIAGGGDNSAYAGEMEEGVVLSILIQTAEDGGATFAISMMELGMDAAGGRFGIGTCARP